MNYWHQITMVRLAISFIAGIVIALLIHLPFHIPSVFSISLFCVYAVLVFRKGLISYKFRWLHGVVISFALILCGFEWCTLNTARYNPYHLANMKADTSMLVIGIISEPLTERENSYSSFLDVKAIKKGAEWQKVDGTILLYFSKDSLSSALEYGDEVVIKAGISEVAAPKNPAEFNYRKYLENKSVYHQAYIKSGSIGILAHHKGNPLIAAALKLQKKLLKILKDENIQGSEYAVVSAMLLGSRDKIDAELISAYAGSGAVHILSVSGLHVGLIFVMLNSVLLFMDKNSLTKILKIIILLGFIWFYAAITGFSAAVLRSTAMFSFIVVGQGYNRKINGFNMLAASLFFLLIINPYLLTDVGFQLSYLAVGGIIGIYPGIYKLLKPSNKIIDKIWSLVSVSLAAQLITAPLAMFYFHQFPNLFLITNLIIIPLTTIIIYTGLGFYFIFYIPFLAGWVAKLLAFMVYALNEIVRFIEHLPFAVTHGICINFTEMLLIFAVVFSSVAFFELRKKIFFLTGLSISVILAFLLVLDTCKHLKNRKIIIYAVNNHTAIDFIDRRKNYFFADSALIADKKKIGFHIQNNWLHLGIKENQLISDRDNGFKLSKDNISGPLFIQDNYIQFFDKRLVVINNINFNIKTTEKLKVDYIILSGNVKTTVRELANSYVFEQLIIDSSNSLWQIKKWMEECRDLSIKAYSVKESGAFIADI